MYIEELKEGETEDGAKELCARDSVSGSTINGDFDARRVMIGVGARALFYPTLLYNVVRNKIQIEFRWWDRVDEV